MLYEKIKQANVQAMKDKDAVARSIYSVLLNKIMLENIKKMRRTNSAQNITKFLIDKAKK